MYMHVTLNSVGRANTGSCKYVKQAPLFFILIFFHSTYGTFGYKEVVSSVHTDRMARVNHNCQYIGEIVRSV